MGCVSGKQFKPDHHDPIMTIQAALLIQRWYRQYMARMEVRRRYTWTIFTSLEYADEQDLSELYQFFNALMQYLPEASQEMQTADRSKIEPETLGEFEFTDDDALGSEHYQGPHLKFPLKSSDINVLIDLFRKKQNNHLHVKYTAAILKAATEHLKTLPNLNVTNTAIAGQITVVGDLHGKLDDLLVIFYKNGLPSLENPYIFNGDFIDRGRKGIEVLLTLLSCSLVFPEAVFLNRGNHEDSVMNVRYGFTKEVHLKYKSNADKILKMIDEVYRWLPLGSTINNSVFIVHGGLSDTTNLKILNKLDRSKFVSILRPPADQLADDIKNRMEWKQVFDIMWSDPMIANGCEPNSLRGAGTYFGPNVTNDFLRKFHFKYLVRSHECKPEGYEILHNRKVITIFSASNYYTMGSNKGAYMKFNQYLEPRFVQYVSAASKSINLSLRQRVGIVENSALRELGGRLQEHREDLCNEFEKLDPENTGYITLSQWTEVMTNVTNFDLPWTLLRTKLAPASPVSSPNKVDYRSTLELIDNDIIRQESGSQIDVVNALYANKSNLEAIFRLLDKDNTGRISVEEFSDACLLLEKYLPHGYTHEHLLNICKMMDINKDGYVDLNEFLEAFRMSLKIQNMLANSDESVQELQLKRGSTDTSESATLDDDQDIDPSDHAPEPARSSQSKN